MKVKEFISFEKSGAMFVVIDADMTGYMSNPKVLTIADRNVVSDNYGDAELIGFSSAASRRINLYISQK